MTGEDRTEEIRLLREIARWTRESALPVVKERMARLLDTDPKKRVYAALESGTAGMVAIEKVTGVNHNEIGTWIKTWEVEGIVDRGFSPPRATFTLAELGIEPAPPKVARGRKETAA